MKRHTAGFTTLLTAAFFAPVLGLLLPAISLATPIYDEFGPLNEATFDGLGIPNDEVAVSRQITDGNVTITIAMSATQRYSNPALTNDGAGTYFATPGANFGGNGESSALGALWNINGYIMVEGTNSQGNPPVLADYQFTVLYDTDPGNDTPFNDLGVIDVTAVILDLGDPSETVYQTSQNLMFGFVSMNFPPYVTAPTTPFDPNALGEYTFGIQVTNGGWALETVAMDVVVVPEPSTWMLLGLGGTGLWAARRMNRRRRIHRS